MSKIEERINPRTGTKEVFLNGSRLEDVGDDQTALQIEILKELEEDGEHSHQTDKETNRLLELIVRILRKLSTDSSISDSIDELADKIDFSRIDFRGIEQQLEELVSKIDFSKIDFTKIEAVLKLLADKIDFNRIDFSKIDFSRIESLLNLLVEKSSLINNTEINRNNILQSLDRYVGSSSESLIGVKNVLKDIYDKIGEDGSSEEIEEVKKELLILIKTLDTKIDESKLVAGKGIIIKDNVISTSRDSYIDKLIDDYEKLHQEYDRLQERYDKLDDNYTTLQVNYNRLEELKVELEKQLEETKDQYNKSLFTISKLEKEVKRLEEIIASGEDYKLYKKYQQMYYKVEKEAAKWRKEYEECSGIAASKRREMRGFSNNVYSVNIGGRCGC